MEFEIGNLYTFGELWGGNGNGIELLNSGAISPDNENVVAFEVIEDSEDIFDVLVKVTDIY